MYFKLGKVEVGTKRNFTKSLERWEVVLYPFPTMKYQIMVSSVPYFESSE